MFVQRLLCTLLSFLVVAKSTWAEEPLIRGESSNAHWQKAHWSWAALARDLIQERLLQTVPIPPTRSCGQVIGVTPREVSVGLFSSVAEALYTNTSLESMLPTIMQVFEASVKYDIQASVLCSSCDQVSNENLLADTDTNGFGTYCAQDAYGSNATYSGLLFLPLDNETDALVANKKLKGSMFMHGTTVNTAQAPSELWPEDLQQFIGNMPDLVSALGALYDTVSPMFAAAAGTVSIAPDYTGFGQSTDFAKAGGVQSLYQQSSVPLWLEAQKMVAEMSEGCTQLGNAVTVAGYSEGGMSSFSVAQALYRMGVEIISSVVGAAPTNVPLWTEWLVDEWDQQVYNIFVGLMVAYYGSSFSSTNPDLANTDVNQDLLKDEWMNPANFSQWAQGWISSDLSAQEAAAFVPFPDYLQMVNPNLVDLMRTAIAANETDPCSLAEAGTTDKMCQAMLDNSLATEIASPKFPVTLCHSPDDDIVPYEGQHPDPSGSLNLTDFNLLGMTATGTHAEAAVFCLFPMVLPFTSMSGPAAVEQEPLESCNVPTDAPVSPPTAAPAPSSGHRASISMATLVLTSLVWAMF